MDGSPSGFWRISAILALLVTAVAFVGPVVVQNIRYSYVVSNGVVWRVDRFSEQACRVTHDGVDCSPLPPSKSKSTSLSTSTSTSTSVKAGTRAQSVKKG